MQEIAAQGGHPELKQLVLEASLALARLDAGRLEELALSCQALNRDIGTAGKEDRGRLAGQAREADGDMAVFARVLEVTRGNLKVLNRLREMRAGRLEYGEAQARGWTGSGHGDN